MEWTLLHPPPLLLSSPRNLPPPWLPPNEEPPPHLHLIRLEDALFPHPVLRQIAQRFLMALGRVPTPGGLTWVGADGHVHPLSHPLRLAQLTIVLGRQHTTPSRALTMMLMATNMKILNSTPLMTGEWVIEGCLLPLTLLL